MVRRGAKAKESAVTEMGAAHFDIPAKFPRPLVKLPCALLKLLGIPQKLLGIPLRLLGIT